MSEVDWNVLRAELNAAPAPKRENDGEVSEPSEMDLLKHIEKALRMDIARPGKTAFGADSASGHEAWSPGRDHGDFAIRRS